MTRRVWRIWRKYQPEPMEFCSGLGLVSWAALAVRTDDVLYRRIDYCFMAVAVVLGLLAIWLSCRSRNVDVRGRIICACGIFWTFLAGTAIHRYGSFPYEGPYGALALGSFIAAVREWDHD